MKPFLILLLVFTSQVARAQDDVLAQLFDQYEGKDNFTTVYITSKMFSLIAQIPQQENEEDFMNIVRRLTGIRVLSSDSIPEGKKLYQKTVALLDKNGYDDLMIVNDGEDQIKFLVREKGDVISNFVMVSGGENKFTLISLTGNLRMNDISKISKSMDMQGFDKLDKINDKSKPNN